MWLIKKNNINIKCLKNNVIFLSRLSFNHQFCMSQGAFVLKKKRKIADIFSFFLLQFIKQHLIKQVITWSFEAFYYSLIYPRSRQKRQNIYKKKQNIGLRAIDNLERLKFSNKFCDKLRQRIRSFEELIYWQDKTQYLANKACKGAGKSSLQKEIQLALVQGISPIRNSKGASGSYLMRNQYYQKVAIFKPFDEEIGSPYNPKGIKLKEPLGINFSKAGIRSGQCLHREVVAYKISHFLHLHLVPKTEYACFKKSELFHGYTKDRFHDTEQIQGSLQVFINEHSTMANILREGKAWISDQEIQNLLIFDLITGQLDRHLHNILVKDNKLIAIDNGWAFGEKIVDLQKWPCRKLLKKDQIFTERSIETIFFSANLISLLNRSFLSTVAKKRAWDRIRLLQEAALANLTLIETLRLFSKKNLKKIAENGATYMSLTTSKIHNKILKYFSL